MARCTAIAKGTGEQCKKDAVQGSTKCHMHGGKTPRGMASPHYKHGRYSKDLPSRLADKYQEARSDSELLALRDDIALVDARLRELVGRIDTGEADSLWRWLEEAVDDLLIARRSKDQAGIAAAVNDIVQAVEKGSSERKTWAEIFDLLERRKRLVESERKRLVDMQQMITSERAMLLLSVVVDTVRRHVNDRDALAAISADIGKLVSDEAVRGPGSGE